MKVVQRKGVTIADDAEFSVEHFFIPKCYKNDFQSIIIPEGMIRDRVKQLAHEIHNEIGDQELTMLCILKGSYRFFTNLIEELTNARKECNSPLLVNFIRIKSYENMSSTETVQIIGLSNLQELVNKNILIVEDIVDTGRTLHKLINTLNEIGARKVWTSLLLSKRVTRVVECAEDFVAFNIPDKFIVGHGLDYNEVFRDMNHICVMSEEGINRYKAKQN